MAPFGGLLRGPAALVAGFTDAAAAAAAVAATAVPRAKAPATTTAAATSPLPRSSATGSSAGGVAPSSSTPFADAGRGHAHAPAHPRPRPQMTDLDQANVVGVLRAGAPSLRRRCRHHAPAKKRNGCFSGTHYSLAPKRFDAVAATPSFFFVCFACSGARAPLYPDFAAAAAAAAAPANDRSPFSPPPLSSSSSRLSRCGTKQ